MARLLVILLTFLLASTAGAEQYWLDYPVDLCDSDGKNCVTVKHHDTLSKKDILDIARVENTLADNCLATLEAAMRDAEWFLTKPLKREGAYTVPNVDYPGMEKQIHAKAQAMWKQWDAAKKCWRTP